MDTYSDWDNMETFFLTKDTDFTFTFQMIIATYLPGGNYNATNNSAYQIIGYNAEVFLQNQMEDGKSILIMSDNGCKMPLPTVQNY